jgi:hypothetical protein
MQNLEPISSKTREIAVIGTNRSFAISRYERGGFLSKQPETAAEKSLRES